MTIREAALDEEATGQEIMKQSGPAGRNGRARRRVKREESKELGGQTPFVDTKGSQMGEGKSNHYRPVRKSKEAGEEDSR